MRSYLFRKLAFLFLASVGSLLLPGCFDLQEVDDMNIVIALGIDRTANGLVRVTAQLVNPEAVPTAGGGDSGSAGGVRSFLIREETGRFIEEAVEKFKADVPHGMYLAHNTLVVFGSDYAKQGIDRGLDYFERTRYFRRNQLLVATSGQARDVLSASSDPEPLNALGVRAVVEQIGEMFRVVNSAQLQVMKEYLSPSQAPVLSLVDRDASGHLFMKGVALFRGAKMVDVLTVDETKGLAWLMMDTRQVVIPLPCDGKGDGVGRAVRLLGSRTKVIPQFGNDGVSFLVKVQARGEIDRLCPHDQLNEKTYQQLEQETAEYMERQMQAVVTKLQSDGVDACQFGTRLFIEDPRQWRKISQQWSDYFAHAKVKCNVRVHITRTALSSNTPESAASRSGLAPLAGRGVTTP
ncbi:MAG: Ger(x)C family spore germination protein [Alicyclobacillus herbarius]|uniref:Ger(x)C family spore germination protein n=1 Tax=Alicyclobacillus herbarius TaxID=122960 RepID=UPI0023579C2E|nr:Ger(x)C family spore germination protein [Alicyclobacillus herbarius]MCL6632808.1 Ger(x)C family spore germination protein [Alicyclobacillus herbarius]